MGARVAAGTKKIEALDSVRGIAALIVVMWHFASAFFPAVMSGPGFPTHTQYDLVIYKSPLSIFFAGNFAVVMFFILSGFVLTIRFFSSQSGSLFSAAVKRYLRLMPVALLSVLFAYGLMSLGLLYARQAGAVSGSSWLLSTYYLFDPSLLGALAQGSFQVFATMAPKNVYNPVLWTMYYELLGSMLIFGLATLSRGKSKRWLLYIIAFLAFIDTYFCCFIAGMVLADVYANRPLFFEKLRNLALFYKLSLLFIALSIAGYPYIGDPSSYGKYWHSLTLLSSNVSVSRILLQMIAGSIIIILALSWSWLIKLLETKFLVLIGRLSFALYATHFIILYSLTCWLFVLLHGHLNYVASAMLALLLSLPVLFFVSVVVHKYIELPSIRAANKLGNWAKD